MTDRRLLDLLDVRVALGRWIETALGQIARPSIEEPVLRVGLDPLRVLIVGGGTAMGYGVRDRADALDGQLAERIAARTGRGVVLHNRCRAGARLTDVTHALQTGSAHTFELLICSPAYSEVPQRLSMRGWHAALTAMIDRVREHDDPHVLLLHLPLVTGGGALGEVTRRWAARINATIDQVARERPRVTACAVASPEMADARTVGLDRAHYTRTVDLMMSSLFAEQGWRRAG